MTERPTMHALKKAGLQTFTSLPVAGYYEMQQFDPIKWVGVHIWFGPPVDPNVIDDDGLPMSCDRSYRWYALIDGNALVSADDVWVSCCARPITADAYTSLLQGDHQGETVSRIDFMRS